MHICNNNHIRKIKEKEKFPTTGGISEQFSFDEEEISKYQRRRVQRRKEMLPMMKFLPMNFHETVQA